MKFGIVSDNKSNCIYERSIISRVNSLLLKSYSKLLCVYAVLLAFGLTTDIFDLFMCFSKWIRGITCKNHFTILSIVVTLLSVVMATFSIIFGNFKICNINASLVLKQMYIGTKRILTVAVIIMLMATPFIMIIAQLANWQVFFFCSFIVAFINLFFMLDVCLTLFTDNGIRYVEIPENISRELQVSVCSRINSEVSSYGKKERLLYDGYVQGITCDDYSVNRIVVPSVVLKNFDLKYSTRIMKDSKESKGIQINFETKACMIYKMNYRFFRDIRKYLDRNTASVPDFIETYSGLCYNSLTAVFVYSRKMKERGDGSFPSYIAVLLALFRCLLEMIYKIETDEEARSYDSEISKLLMQINNNDKRLIPDSYYHEANEIRMIIWLLLTYQMEYILSSDRQINEISDAAYENISNVIRLLSQETIMCAINIKSSKSGESMSDNKTISTLLEESKQLFWQFSCGIFDSVYETTFNQNPAKTIGSVDRISYDICTFLGMRSNDFGDRPYVKSSLYFIYKLFEKGGIV